MRLIKNIRVLGLGFICSIALSTYTLANEQNITKKNVPQSIILSFEKSYPNAKALNYSKETVKGKTTYEVESKDGNTKRDLTYSANGQILEIEEVIPLSSLPKDVIQSLNKSYPKANIVTIEKITKGNNIS
ncbi:MAG: PepSY-like domain-containing protein, partial [Candidatus Sericytochromatia bacterium]|nr:PepSY-like domain-containing protein [Candidatus Sericytochromatia bacterium]